MESDRAEEAEEGGVEIKLNTNWQRDKARWSEETRQPEGWSVEKRTEKWTHARDGLQSH